MSQFHTVLEAFEKNEELAKAIKASYANGDAAAIVAAAKESGFDLELEEVEAYIERSKRLIHGEGNAELTEGQLEGVAGGFHMGDLCWLDRCGPTESRDGVVWRKCLTPACTEVNVTFPGITLQCRCYNTEICVDRWHKTRVEGCWTS